MDKITIVEDTKQARDEHGHAYGSGEYQLSDRHIQALMLGKVLALEVNAEYVAFIKLKD